MAGVLGGGGEGPPVGCGEVFVGDLSGCDDGDPTARPGEVHLGSVVPGGILRARSGVRGCGHNFLIIIFLSSSLGTSKNMLLNRFRLVSLPPLFCLFVAVVSQ